VTSSLITAQEENKQLRRENDILKTENDTMKEEIKQLTTVMVR